jgi:hypothetical protein
MGNIDFPHYFSRCTDFSIHELGHGITEPKHEMLEYQYTEPICTNVTLKQYIVPTLSFSLCTVKDRPRCNALIVEPMIAHILQNYCQ